MPERKKQDFHLDIMFEIITATEKAVQMAPNHMKRCSSALVIREMQIKTALRSRLSPVRLARLRKGWNAQCVGK